MSKSRTVGPDVWVDRYLECRGTPEYMLRIDEDAEMLKSLGAVAYGFSPGVSIGTPGGDSGQGYARLDTASWNWLRPLLVELLHFREEAESHVRQQKQPVDVFEIGDDNEHR